MRKKRARSVAAPPKVKPTKDGVDDEHPITDKQRMGYVMFDFDEAEAIEIVPVRDGK